MVGKDGGTIMNDVTLVETLNEHLTRSRTKDDLALVDILNERLTRSRTKDDLALVDILNERLTRIRAIAGTTDELRDSPKEVHTEIVEELMRVIVLEVDGAKQDLSEWEDLRFKAV
jgi:hypothetical protein